MTRRGRGEVRAAVLAAGCGTRMGQGAARRHKCTLDVGGRPIVARTLETLADAGIRRITLVVGHLAPQVIACAAAASRDLEVRPIVNAQFASSGTARSLALGLAETAGDTVLVIEGDVVFGPEALACVLDGGSPDATLVAPFVDGTTGSGVVCDRDRLVRDWFHGDDPAAAGARPRASKTVNLTRLRSRTASLLLDQCLASQPDAPLEHALGSLVRSGRASIEAAGVGDAPWCEVDTLAELRAARKLFATNDGR